MFDYETIRVIWWLFIGVVAIAFALTEGFDLGVGALLPPVVRQRRKVQQVVVVEEEHRLLA